MNSPISRSSAALIAMGAVAVLLLGAFAPFNSNVPPTPMVAVAAPAPVAAAPQMPANLSPGLAEIIKLAQAHVDEDVVLEFIKNSGQTYAPSADEILYLKDLGLSQTVIGALYRTMPASPQVASNTAAPVVAASNSVPPPPVVASSNQFYAALAPYGNWFTNADLGQYWQPTAETVNPDWRPYVDEGQWLYVDDGWSWQSRYSWGWAPFHYGRWSRQGALGWVWVPGNTWGPAWVSWRIGQSYCGWAPLPPGVALAETQGLMFNNTRVAADYDFGLSSEWYAFVNEENMMNENLPGFVLPAGLGASVFGATMVVNNYTVVNQTVVNRGPGLTLAVNTGGLAKGGKPPGPIRPGPGGYPGRNSAGVGDHLIDTAGRSGGTAGNLVDTGLHSPVRTPSRPAPGLPEPGSPRWHSASAGPDLRAGAPSRNYTGYRPASAPFYGQEYHAEPSYPRDPGFNRETAFNRDTVDNREPARREPPAAAPPAPPAPAAEPSHAAAPAAYSQASAGRSGK